MTNKNIHGFAQGIDYISYEETSASLIIRGIGLDFLEIEERMGIKPTQVIRQGEISIEGMESNREDVWIYDAPIDKSLPLIDHLTALQKVLDSHKEYSQTASTKWKMIIHCNFQIDLAMGGFVIPNQLIKMFSIYNIDFEVSFLILEEPIDEKLLSDFRL